MSMCSNGGTYTGDPVNKFTLYISLFLLTYFVQYLRLYDSAGTLLTLNDDYCGLGSQMSYTITSCR